jgi:beta-lactamase class A
MNNAPRTVDVEAHASELITSFSGLAAYFARNLTTGAEFSHRPDVVMPTASTIKLLVLAELFRRVDAGDVTLDERVPLVPDDVRGGSGILKDLDPGALLTLRDHATLMIALSDNTSTQVLVRLLGREHILASARGWGLTQTTARFRVAETDPARDYAASTPRDIVRLLELIATDALISPAACQGIRDILVTQQYHDQIGRYLPYNQYERTGARHPGPVVVLSKSGFMGGVRVDAGIVQLPDVQYVLCLMNEDSADVSYLPEQEGAVLNGRISRLIYDAWAG